MDAKGIAGLAIAFAGLVLAWIGGQQQLCENEAPWPICAKQHDAVRPERPTDNNPPTDNPRADNKLRTDNKLSSENQPPPTEPKKDPFDLSQLSPAVTEAVSRARTAKQRALIASNDAKAASARADEYSSSRLRPFGRAKSSSGASYSGALSNSRPHGLGVEIAAPVEATNPPLRYEGTFEFGRKGGYGIQYWSNGDRHEGIFAAEDGSGVGVLTRTEGTRYEGEWRRFKPHGAGVEWTPDGRVIFAGMWVDGRPQRQP